MYVIIFFSSRRRHTRYWRDWSSDVCSSDLYYGVPKQKAKERADDLLERFALTGKRKQRVNTLSGGMKRRVLFARALMHDPKVLFLDEPTAGVDVELRYKLWGYIRELNREGLTILLTTHYLEEAEEIGRAHV